MKKNIRDQIKVAAYGQLTGDEKLIFDHATERWLKDHPGDDEGAALCAHGAVICYGVLLEGSDMIDDDDNDGEPQDQDVIPGSLDTTAMAGADYVRHYRECLARGNKAPYATQYAGVMLVSGDVHMAHDIAVGNPVEEERDDKAARNPYGHNPMDCRFVREHEIAFDEFDIRHCAECGEGTDCDIQQDLQERFLGGDGNAPANLAIPEDE